MEPNLPMPVQPERTPQPSGGNENVQQYNKPEESSGGRVEKVGELQPVVQQPAPATTTPVAQPLPGPSSAQPVVNPQTTINDSPIIADDVDVIEKEWVDKAKKIVSATKEDPHQQEKQVSELQSDYLMKRYNKKIKQVE